jgi:uncharacterized membrane protein
VLNPAPLLLVGILLALTTAWAWRTNRRDLLALGGWLLLALLPIAGVLANYDLGDDGWLWSVAAWVIMFLLDVFMIRTGLHTEREGWVNLGIAGIGLNILTRYFDLFGTMMQGGLFFIITGVIVIALGIYLEKKRRALLAQLRHPEVA